MAPQLGNGTVVVSLKNGGAPIAFIASHYGPAGFRELIVAKPSTVSAPLQLNNFRFQGMPSGYTNPQLAEADFVSFLGGGGPNNYDRWWVDSAVVSPVGGYSNPPQSHSFHEVAGAADKSSNDDISLWCLHTSPAGPRETVTNLMLARKQGTGGPDVTSAAVRLFGTNIIGIATGAQFEAIAQSYLGAQMQRYETTETITKLVHESPPGNWNGTPH